MGIDSKPSRSLQKDPYLSYRFHVEIDGLVSCGFQEVTGLTLETEVETFREGGTNLYQQELAGASKFPSKLVLKRGLADADTLWVWYEGVLHGAVVRKNVSILLLDPASDQEHWRWNIREACPVKWTGPEFRAGSAEIAFESVDLIHRGLLYSTLTRR